MTDRELVEQAAAAAGIQGVSHWGDNPIHRGIYVGGVKYWNPLADDGDAFRLASDLEIESSPGEIKCVASWWERPGMIERRSEVVLSGADRRAAMRLAIVLAAAQIGTRISTPSLGTSKGAT